MWKWLTENISTVIIAVILLAVLTAIAVRLIRNKKQGKSSCGCGCKNCALSGKCRCAPSESAAKQKPDTQTLRHDDSADSFS